MPPGVPLPSRPPGWETPARKIREGHRESASNEATKTRTSLFFTCIGHTPSAQCKQPIRSKGEQNTLLYQHDPTPPFLDKIYTKTLQVRTQFCGEMVGASYQEGTTALTRRGSKKQTTPLFLVPLSKPTTAPPKTAFCEKSHTPRVYLQNNKNTPRKTKSLTDGSSTEACPSISAG